MSKISLLSTSGSATCGKDTLITILKSILSKYSIEIERIALADLLKSELNEFTTKNYGISAYTSNPAEKALIRDLMVVHGKIKRKQTNGKYFTSYIKPRLNELISNNIIPIISDCRYTTYSEDEDYFVKSNNGVIIFIERTLPDGSLVPPANDDERINNISLKQSADYFLSWPTSDNKEFLEDCVKIQLGKLIDRLISERIK